MGEHVSVIAESIDSAMVAGAAGVPVVRRHFGAFNLADDGIARSCMLKGGNEAPPFEGYGQGARDSDREAKDLPVYLGDAIRPLKVRTNRPNLGESPPEGELDGRKAHLDGPLIQRSHLAFDLALITGKDCKRATFHGKPPN
jgi:hypothetical protein